MSSSVDYQIETTHESVGILGVLLVICVIDLIIGAYRPVLRTNIPGISEINIVIYILFFISIYRVIVRGKNISIHGHDYIILIYAIYCFFMVSYACLSYKFNFLEEFIQLKTYLNPFILYFLFKNAIDNTKQARILISVLIVVLVLSSAICIAGYFFWPNIFLKKTALKTIINQPNLSGMFIITLFPFLFFAFHTKRVLSWMIKIIFVVIVIVALIQTGSRGALLGLCCAFCLGAFDKKIKLTIFFSTVIVLLGVFLAIQYGSFKTMGVFDRVKMEKGTDLTTYSSGRWGAWKGIVIASLEKPFWGHGFNSFSRIYGKKTWGRKLATHNEYLNLFFSLGLIGFLLFAAIYYKVWILLSKNNELVIAQACRYGLTGFFVHIAFSNPHTVRYIAWLIIAITLRFIQLQPMRKANI